MTKRVLRIQFPGGENIASFISEMLLDTPRGIVHVAWLNELCPNLAKDLYEDGMVLWTGNTIPKPAEIEKAHAAFEEKRKLDAQSVNAVKKFGGTLTLDDLDLLDIEILDDIPDPFEVFGRDGK